MNATLQGKNYGDVMSVGMILRGSNARRTKVREVTNEEVSFKCQLDLLLIHGKMAILYRVDVASSADC
jgi:hypothetical protein